MLKFTIYSMKHNLKECLPKSISLEGINNKIYNLFIFCLAVPYDIEAYTARNNDPFVQEARNDFLVL